MTPDGLDPQWGDGFEGDVGTPPFGDSLRADVDSASVDAAIASDLETAATAGVGARISATYDVLSLVCLFEEVDPPHRAAIHTFAYLACLMSLFNGRPASEWGYAFTAVPPTLPFSPDLEDALHELLHDGLIMRTESKRGTKPGFVASGSGREEWAFLGGLDTLSTRAPFLRASVAAAVLHSPAMVLNALANEPQLAQAMKTQTVKQLLGASTSASLYAQFAALEGALGGLPDDLVVPASLYVRFLSSSGTGSARAEV